MGGGWEGDEPLVGENKNLVDGEIFTGVCGEGVWSKFLSSEGTPPFPSRKDCGY